MARKQIKELLIVTETKGTKEAANEIAQLNVGIDNINKGVTSFNKRAQSFSASITTLSRRSGTLSKNLTSVADSAKSINRAFAGSASQTKKLDGYLVNLEVLSSVLLDVAKSANIAEASLESVNATSGMTNLISILKQIETNTGKTSNRLKQTRDSITDLDVTTNRAGETLEEFAKRANQASSSTDKLGRSSAAALNAQRRLGEGGRSTARSFSQLAFASNPLVLAYASLAVNVFAATQAFRLLNEAAQFDRLQTQLSGFSAAISGLDVNELAKDMQEASAGALSLKESLSFASRGTAFNFTTEQLENLTIGARKASIALGRDFNDSLDRVLKGISKQEIELFDELGIVTRLTPAFQAYAAQVGKSVEELTDYERQLALTNEVQKQLDDKFKGIEVGATAWETLGVNAKNATDNLLISISQGLEPIIAKFNELTELVGIFGDIEDISNSANVQGKLFADSLAAGNTGAALNALEEGSRKIEKLKEQLVESEIAANKLKGSTRGLSGALNSSKELVSEGIVRATTLFARMVGGDEARNSIGDFNESVKVLVSGTAEYNAKLKEQAVIKAEIAKLEAQRTEQLKIIAQQEGVDAKDITATSGNVLLGFQKSLEDSIDKVQKFSATNSAAVGPLGDVAQTLKGMETGLDDVTEKLQGFETSNILAQAKAFEDLEKTLQLDKSVNSLGKLVDLTARLNTNLNELSTRDALQGIDTGAKNEGITQLEGQLARRKQIQRDSILAGKLISDQDKDKLDKEIQILEAKLKQLRIDTKLAENLQNLSTVYQIRIDNLALERTSQEDTTALQLKKLNLEIALNMFTGKNTDELMKQKAILENQLRIQKALTAEQLASAARTSQSNTLNRDLGLAGSAADRVSIQQKILDLRKEEAKNINDVVQAKNEEYAIALAQENLDRDRAAAPFRDAQASFAGMQSLSGLTDLQSTGLGIAESFSDVFAQAEESGQGFTEFLMGNAEAFRDFGISLSNSANSIFQSLSQSKIDSIDREIEAEKARDGQSAKSLAKIKKLEAQKIKEQAKAKKASVIMSTATAIMQGYADLGPIAGSVSAAILAGLGALQLSQINKAAAGQVDALNTGGSSGMSITGGNRNNSIDVSRTANAGEINYIRGGSGVGNANNFGGRVGGGTATSGTRLTVGERGPEEITPLVPVAVTPAGNSNSSTPSIVLSPQYNISTVDSTGFEALTDRFSKELYNSLEKELQAKNMTLASLG